MERRPVHHSLGTSAQVDPRDARADELDAVGDHRAADRVRACGRTTSTGDVSYCHTRSCPTCAEWSGRRRGDQLIAVADTYERPIALLIKLPTCGSKDLLTTYTTFSAALLKLRRRVCMRDVIAAVGGIEVVRWRRQQWLVHVHLIADVRPSWNACVARDAWEALTEGRGDLSVDQIDTVAAATRYALKGLAPRPRSMPPRMLALWRAVVHGRRLVVRWGARRRAGGAS